MRMRSPDEPRALSARYDLGGVSAVALGRGSERRAERNGADLLIRVPDRWMSSRHTRIEPSFGRAGRHRVEERHLRQRPADQARPCWPTVIELGHTLLVFCEKLAVRPDAPTIVDPSGSRWSTPGWRPCRRSTRASCSGCGRSRSRRCRC
jgi:hypothetical protein